MLQRYDSMRLQTAHTSTLKLFRWVISIPLTRTPSPLALSSEALFGEGKRRGSCAEHPDRVICTKNRRHQVLWNSSEFLPQLCFAKLFGVRVGERDVRCWQFLQGLYLLIPEIQSHSLKNSKRSKKKKKMYCSIYAPLFLRRLGPSVHANETAAAYWNIFFPGQKFLFRVIRRVQFSSSWNLTIKWVQFSLKHKRIERT